jgi:hypothetical protein
MPGQSTSTLLELEELDELLDEDELLLEEPELLPPQATRASDANKSDDTRAQRLSKREKRSIFMQPVPEVVT